MAIFIGQELAEAYQDSFLALLGAIREAISHWQLKHPNDAHSLPLWQTPTPWMNTVLPNLMRYEADIKEAIISSLSDRTRKLRALGHTTISLGKQLDNFSQEWMDPVSKEKLNIALERVVVLSDRLIRW